MKTIAQQLMRSIKFSLQGFDVALREQFAFRLEIFLSAILLPLALWLGNTPLSKMLLASSWLFVLIIELINSAIETCIDRISIEPHPFSRAAKDMASAAVFIAVLNCCLIWGIFLVARVY